MNDVTLTRTEINSFMGINSSAPVLLDFTRAYKNGKNITTLSGDQGTGKTSTIMAILYLLGANFDFDKDNLINLTDETINLEQDFTVDGVKYRVKATKSRFVLERYVEEPGKKSGKWYNEDEPKTTLQKLVGNLGVSPMFLKSLDGEKQIEWFRKTFSDSDETAFKKEQSLKKKLKELTSARRAANGDYTRLKKSLEIDPLYIGREENYKRFEKPINAESERKKVEELSKAASDYERAEISLQQIKENIKTGESDIERMEDELKKEIDRRRVEIENKKKSLEELKVRKQKGDEYVAENATIKQEYKEAQDNYMKVSEVIAEQTQWQEVLKKEKEMNEYEEQIKLADAQKDELQLQLLKITKKYLPEINGLEIKIATGIDDEQEGIYYEGKTLAQLSESELWALFFLIWEQKDVMFVFIENIQDIGSKALETLNTLAKKGVKIFASMMDRKKESMKITIIDELK